MNYLKLTKLITPWILKKTYLTNIISWKFAAYIYRYISLIYPNFDFLTVELETSYFLTIPH